MKQSIRKIITDISIDNGFFPIDIANCYEQNAETIDSITSVFELRNKKDEEIVETACEVISKSFDNFTDCFAFENESDKEQKLLVITAFMKNIQFFSMCWNLMIIEKNSSIQNKSNVLTYKVYDYQEYLAAASEGMKKFGKEQKISGFGAVGQMCDIEDGEYSFYIELTEDSALRKFTVEIEFMNEDKQFKASIISKGDGKKNLRSNAVKVENIFSGIRNLIIKIIPIE